MSRVGKKLILIPEGVDVKIEGQKVTVKGPKGELLREFLPEIKIELKEGKILTAPATETSKGKKLTPRHAKRMASLWGSTRAILANMIKGVAEGFEKKIGN